MSAISRAIDSRSTDCGNDGVWLWRARMSAMLHAVDSRSTDCGNDGVWLQRAPMSAISRAVDSRSRDCGNDGFLIYYQLPILSSRKFRRGEITTLIRLSEIIRDLQRTPTSAILRAVDSRSGDCGNDGFILYYQLSSPSSQKFRRDEITTLIRLSEIIRDLQRARTPATLHAVDSRSKDCGNDGFLLYCQLSSLSSRKFRRGEITTLIRLSEIIRDI
jgi:hypothetical protein